MPGKTHRVGRSLINVTKEFATDEQCLAYLEAMRWPEGVRCVECDSARVSKFTTKESSRTRTNRDGKKVTVKVPARHLYQCLDCKHQFSATVGTIFGDTHLPLRQWFLAVALMCNAKKGVSAKQLERDLDVNYRTAWYLSHRIRKAMENGNVLEPMTGTVECDETYVGGKYDRRRKRERWDKEPVWGIVERKGKVKAYHMPEVNRFNIYGKIRDHVSADADLVITDDAHLYKNLGQYFPHEIVNHSIKQYVRGDVHTNTIENFWSLFKRGVIGSYHKVSIKHLDRYLAEFCYRFNHRRTEDLFALVIMNLLIGSMLRYAELTASPKPSASE